MTQNTSEPPKKKRSIFADLSIPQVLAGALSAITVALILTELGFSGTLIGAGIGSVIGALGTTAYSQSLNKSAELVKKKLPKVTEGRVGSLQPEGFSAAQTVVLPTTITERATAETAEETDVLPSYSPHSLATTPEEPGGESKRPTPNWKSIALLAVVSLTVALAFLSFFEVRMLSENRADGVVIQRVLAPSDEPEKEVIVEREVVIVETPASQDNSSAGSGSADPARGNSEHSEQEAETDPQQDQEQSPQEEEDADEGSNTPEQEPPTPAPTNPEEPSSPELPAPNPAPAPVVPPSDEPESGDQPDPPTQPDPNNPGSGSSEDKAKKNSEEGDSESLHQI